MIKYQKTYGVSEELGLRKEVVRHKYGEKYEEFKSKGILKEKWHGDQCCVTEHQVRMGEEHGAEEGSQLKRQKKRCELSSGT